MKRFFVCACLAVACSFVGVNTAEAGLFSRLFSGRGCSSCASSQASKSNYVYRDGKTYRKECTPKGCRLVEVK